MNTLAHISDLHFGAESPEVVLGLLEDLESVAPSLVDAIHDQTEGNPLFVGEMTRLLIHEGVLGASQRDASPAERAAVPLRIPEGIKEVIGRRLNRLSQRANQVLTCAAMIGRAFESGLLVRLMDEELDEELRARADHCAPRDPHGDIVDIAREPSATRANLAVRCRSPSAT